MKLRLQPIRVFCFHQISETYDSDVYCKPDWIPLSFLKDYMKQLQSEGYVFITLAEAFQHIQNDLVRTRKYAVLTADDGLLCHLDLFPWLEEQCIPLTMFVNIKNLDGRTCGWPVMNYFKIVNKHDEIRYASKLYCTTEQLFTLSSSIVSIGMHGVTHDPVTKLLDNEFAEQLKICQDTLSCHKAYIPYFAYPYGTHNPNTDKVLWGRNIVPVLADGGVNYNDSRYIHRESIDEIYKCNSQHS